MFHAALETTMVGTETHAIWTLLDLIPSEDGANKPSSDQTVLKGQPSSVPRHEQDEHELTPQPLRVGII